MKPRLDIILNDWKKNGVFLQSEYKMSIDDYCRLMSLYKQVLITTNSGRFLNSVAQRNFDARSFVDNGRTNNSQLRETRISLYVEDNNSELFLGQLTGREISQNSIYDLFNDNRDKVFLGSGNLPKCPTRNIFSGFGL